MKTFSSRIRAFSLIELIVVIMIIGIIAAFTLPAASTILRGSQLTQASQIVTDQFSLARQTALTKNRSVEVRLISYVDPEVPGDAGAYRAIQIMEVLENGVSVPVNKPQLLPQSVVMESTGLSPLVNDAKASPSVPTKVTKASGQDPQLPRNIQQNYSYVAFRFLPDGSTSLPAKSTTDANGTWYVTLVNMNDADKYKNDNNKKPANFFTLQVDPVNGKTKQYRPSV